MNNKLIVEEFMEDNNILNIVSIKNNNNYIYIGSYYKYNTNNGFEWIEFNNNYIVILRKIYECMDEVNNGIFIMSMFDLNKKEFVNKNQDELFNLYYNSFNDMSLNLVY